MSCLRSVHLTRPAKTEHAWLSGWHSRGDQVWRTICSWPIRLEVVQQDGAGQAAETSCGWLQAGHLLVSEHIYCLQL